MQKNLCFLLQMCSSNLLIICLFLVLPVLASTEPMQEDGRVIQRFLTVARAEGLISETQLSSLTALAQSLHEELTEDPEPQEPGVFLKLYNQFTLLNVVYFSGALLIMGAYTLFMTLALERFSNAGLSVIILVQTVVFGLIGLDFWSTEDFQFVGGLFCTISTSTVPFLMYNIQRAIGWWPQNAPGVFQGFRVFIHSGWVVMELVTIAVGLLFLVVVRFPFLFFPVSFCLWFLSMDLAPLVPNFSRLTGQETFEIRRKISFVFGIGMMVSGYLSERYLGSDPDMGFWLYLFGVFIFFMSITFDFPRNDFSGSMYLLIAVSLQLIGSHLNRTTFHVFGTLATIQYVWGLPSGYIKLSPSSLLWLLKAASAAALLSQSIRREGNLEILSALVCVAAFNFNYIAFITSNKFYSIMLLIANLGFVSTAEGFSRPLNLWLFTLPDAGSIIAFVCSILTATYHIRLLVNNIPTPPNSIGAYFSNALHILVSVFISFVLVFLRQPHFTWVGGLGIPLVAVSFSPVLRSFISRGHASSRDNTYTGAKFVIFSLVTFIILLFGVSFSIYLQSNLLYLICCVFMFMTILAHLDKWKILGCILSVLLIASSVPLQSSFLITIGAIYVFLYLSILAYGYFKNSLIFPLALVCLGLVMIFLAIQYQKYESSVHDSLYSALPEPLTILLTQTISTGWELEGSFDWYHKISQTGFSWESFLNYPANWVLWPGALTFALTRGPATFVTAACGVAIVILLLTAAVLSYIESLKKHLDNVVKVWEINFSLSKDPAHDNHGLVIKVKGQKPAKLAKPVHLALNVEGSSFWSRAIFAFGDFPVSFARSMILPYKLTPHLITLTGFTKGSSQFTAEIFLGTGHKGSQKFKHSTVKSALSSLIRNDDEVVMTCVVVYSNSWYNPWSKLCVKDVKLQQIKQQISA